MNAFVDTSALYALMIPEDTHHQAAKACFEELRLAEASLISTNYILLECTSLIQRRQGFEAARSFLIQTGKLLDIVWIDKGHHEQAIALWGKAGRRALSLVDCVSFWVMRNHGLRHALAFDPHFKEAGFEVLPQADRVAEPSGTYRARPLRKRTASRTTRSG